LSHPCKREQSKEISKSYPVEQVSRVGGRDAEARPGLDDGRSGEAHDHHPDVPLQHLPAERSGEERRPETHVTHNIHMGPPYWRTAAPAAGGSPYLGGHVEHHGHDGRVLVAVDDEAHLSEPLAEVDRVPRQLLQTLEALWREETLKRELSLRVNVHLVYLHCGEHRAPRNDPRSTIHHSKV